MEKHSYSNALNRAFFMLNEHSIDQSIATYLLEELMNWNHTKFSIHKNEEMSEDKYNEYFEQIKRAINNEPPQYILGEAWFYGRKFKVNSSTLIPRQETEEMVYKIIEDSKDKKGLNILDIGTGSGDIIITLSKEIPDNNFVASDISDEALKMADTNSQLHDVKISFIKSDVFNNIDGKFDVIVSNPPYISEDERNVMDESVIKYEPHTALFAENNGMKIYEKILKNIEQYLTENGIIYFEFGYKQKESLKQLFEKVLPNFDVEFYKDIAGNDRFLKAYRKEK